MRQQTLPATPSALAFWSQNELSASSMLAAAAGATSMY